MSLLDLLKNITKIAEAFFEENGSRPVAISETTAWQTRINAIVGELPNAIDLTLEKLQPSNCANFWEDWIPIYLKLSGIKAVVELAHAQMHANTTNAPVKVVDYWGPLSTLVVVLRDLREGSYSLRPLQRIT